MPEYRVGCQDNFDQGVIKLTADEARTIFLRLQNYFSIEFTWIIMLIFYWQASSQSKIILIIHRLNSTLIRMRVHSYQVLKRIV